MDSYVSFHRERNNPNYQVRTAPELPEKSFNRLDHQEKGFDKGFDPTFPSLQNVSEDSTRPNYLNNSPTSPYDPGRDATSDEALHKVRTANSVTLSPELFEKLYLSPQNNTKGDLKSTFANPTPLALLGFLLSLSPLSCELMGWRGAGGNGVATIGAYYFIGGFLMSLGGLLEFFLGNTFSFVVFCSFGLSYPSPETSRNGNSNIGRRFLVHPRLHPHPLIQRLRCLRRRPQQPRSRHHQRRLPRQLRFLPSLHGSPKLHLPHLCPADQSRLRRHLPRSATHFRGADRLVLARRARSRRNCGEVADSGGCFWVDGLYGWMVDLSRSDACFGRLPVSDTGWRYLSCYQTFERSGCGEGDVCEGKVLGMRKEGKCSLAGFENVWQGKSEMCTVITLEGFQVH